MHWGWVRAIHKAQKYIQKGIETDVIGKAYATDNSVDNKTLIAVNDAIREHEVEAVGAWLRESMTAMKDIKTVASGEAVTA